MNSITRMILRRVASGDVKLTLRLLEVLKELDREQPGANARKDTKTLVMPPNRRRMSPADEKRLTFVSPQPGRWIRRTGCTVGLAFILVASLVQAASGAGVMDAANSAFAPGRYSEAAHGYEAFIAQQGYSAPVLFNLANAQQRGGQLGKSILNYERAALLSPNDSAIAANLKIARQKAGVELEPRSPMQIVAQTLTMNAWFGLASVALFLFAVSWPLKLLWPQARRSLNVGSVLAAFALTVAVGALGLRSPEIRRAVVVAPEAVAGVSPVTVAAPVFKLQAGEIVRLQQTHGDFALIQNHAGHEGWVNAGKIEQIVPASP